MSLEDAARLASDLIGKVQKLRKSKIPFDVYATLDECAGVLSRYLEECTIEEDDTPIDEPPKMERRLMTTEPLRRRL
jgi:hypothetical protein